MISTSWKNGGPFPGFLWGRVEDYCSWIHSLELLGRKVKLWISRKHLSSFKNACFTLRYYSIPLIILWVLVLLWLLNDTVTCPWGDQGRVWVEWCTASEAETYFVPPLRCLNWSRWICSSSNQSSCLTGMFIQKETTFWNPVTILWRELLVLRDCGWKGDIDFFKNELRSQGTGQPDCTWAHAWLVPHW